MEAHLSPPFAAAAAATLCCSADYCLSLSLSLKSMFVESRVEFRPILTNMRLAASVLRSTDIAVVRHSQSITAAVETYKKRKRNELTVEILMAAAASS